MTSLGVVQVRPTPPVARLDLKAPGAVSELKSAMGMCPHMLGLLFGSEPHPEFDEAFFRSDYWDSRATHFAEEWLACLLEAYPAAKSVGLFVEPQLYPTSKGVVLVMGLLGYGQPVETGIDFSALSQLTSFFDAIGGDPSKGLVEPPFFSAEQRQGLSTETIVVGLSVFALGVWLFVKEK